MREFFKQVLEVLEPIREGFRTTGRHMMTDPVTYEYPEQRKPVPDRARWRHILRRYQTGENAGLERCIGCSLCVRECPYGAVKVENNLAIVDSAVCQAQCSDAKCLAKCPTKAIRPAVLGIVPGTEDQMSVEAACSSCAKSTTVAG